VCSEETPDHCRRLVAEYLKEKWGNLEIVHLTDSKVGSRPGPAVPGGGYPGSEFESWDAPPTHERPEEADGRR
jgi:hypothetical protein